MYLDREDWSTFWNDNFDSNKKLWKVFAYENAMGDIPGLGHTWVGIGAMSWDLQNTHATIWSSWGNAAHKSHYIDNAAPKEYLNGVKYGSSAGLMQTHALKREAFVAARGAHLSTRTSAKDGWKSRPP
jgi:hypothetical protein